ncbi:MAG: energy-coupling factor transporter ATPase [Ruminococcus sp.]|nr:energy-coupling factor transporter ATPase [Ruminococcus sp.]MCD7800845.1 energy-coupling factor transporter ATPase [Ruminococcus sp.]
MKPIIKTQDLTYTYSIGTPFEKTAIDKVNIEINQGEIVGVIGHTGSGKSTLIQHFNGLLRQTSGEIFIDGENIWEDKKNIRNVRFKVGLVFQYPEYQIFEDTVFKDISFGLKNMGLSKEDREKYVLEIADMLQISNLLEKSPFDLSGGQKRRVAIAGVMAMKPKVLILDEPCASLDPLGRVQILSMIKEYHKKTNATILIVSHSMEDMAEFADKILVMNKGKAFCFDDTPKVFNRADELVKIGLQVPQISRVFIKLKSMGYNIPNVYTTSQAVEVLKNMLQKKG